MRYSALLLCLSVAAASAVEILSPDRLIKCELTADSHNHLTFGVQFKGQSVIEPSPLGIILNHTNIAHGVEIGDSKTIQINEKYPWRGVHSEAVNHCNGVTISLTHRDTKTAYTIEARAFNDGIAFRHVIPGADGSRIPDENTSFKLPAGSTVWYHDLGGHYEAVHQSKDVKDVAAGDWAAPPLTFKPAENRGYASITEAALINYSGMALQAEGNGVFKVVLGHKHPISYPFRLRYSNDIERVSKPAAITGTITSPWRVVMIGPDLNALVNSDIIHNLSPPADKSLFPEGMNTSWIKPGRAVWKYLDGGSNTFDNMKDFCRWAGELGFEYNIIEGFWRRWSDSQLQELVDYGKKNGVGIWLWRHSKELREPQARREFFKRCKDLGVVGVKLDFFDHEAKEVVDFYQTLLRETAEHKLMVNFHGANKPTGEARTWPNELVREGVRGMESSRLKERARHNTTLPFTRFLAGHADYTPVHFGARRGDTTWAHQIATAVVFTEPLLTYAAHPTNLLSNPGVEMIKSIPAVWDETIVLPPSEIGRSAVFARRSGTTWFLAILNGPEPLKTNVALSFLGEGNYRGMLIRDKKDSETSLEIEGKAARRGDSLAIDLNAGGGFIARFAPN